MTYPEEFPPGTRVKVSAGPFEGTDYSLYNGAVGTIEGWRGFCWAEVRLDREPRRTAIITGHNITRELAK
jgi:hypothetical protein